MFVLWHFKPAVVLKRVKQVLVSLGNAKGQHFTFKSIRAGRATEMAQQGFTIAQILRAGEWRSVAFLRYCDVDQVDPNAMLTSTLDGSEDEAVDDEGNEEKFGDGTSEATMGGRSS